MCQADNFYYEEDLPLCLCDTVLRHFTSSPLQGAANYWECPRCRRRIGWEDGMWENDFEED